jgi:hypothetical protein
MKVFFIFLLIFLPAILYAQPGPPGDPDVPITGIEILIGAGAAYGLSRKWLRKKQQSD